MSRGTAHPALDAIDAALAGVVVEEPVELRGSWTPSTRRTYGSPSQSGTGSGPFAEVVDLRWQGVLCGRTPLVAVGFLETPSDVFWAKSRPASPQLPVELALHAYADWLPGRATFSAAVGGAILPGVPVAAAAGDTSGCAIREGVLTTGRVLRIAALDDASLAILLLPKDIVETGRRRLWRMRDTVASPLPPPVRALLTRRRTGTLRSSDDGTG